MKGRRDVLAGGSGVELSRALDAAGVSPGDRREVERFRRYLRGEMGAGERFEYEHGPGQVADGGVAAAPQSGGGGS